MIQINKLLMVVIFLVVGPIILLSQESEKVEGKGLYIGVGLGQGWTRVKGEVMAPSVAGMKIADGTALSGSVVIGYHFNRYLGLSSGIGYAGFNSKLSLDSYQSKFTAADSEGESYEMRVTATGITEDQKIGYLYVPLCLNVRLPLTQTLGLFLEPGVNLCFPVVHRFEGSGTFTYKGYYSKYNALLENLPGYGFPSNNNLTASGDLELKPFCVMASLSGGLDYFLSEKVQLALLATYQKSLSNISSCTGNEKYQLSSDYITFSSLMAGSVSASAQSVGVSVKIRYYF